MTDISIAIPMTEAKAAVERLPEGTSLEDRIRTAMKATHRHWMVTDEDAQFRAAVAAAILTGSDDEQERLKQEVDSLKSLNALISGVPVDLDRMVEQAKASQPVGLLKLWDEVRSGPSTNGKKR